MVIDTTDTKMKCGGVQRQPNTPTSLGMIGPFSARIHTIIPTNKAQSHDKEKPFSKMKKYVLLGTKRAFFLENFDFLRE